MLSEGKELVSGFDWISWVLVNLEIGCWLLKFRNVSCFSVVVLVIGWN